MAGTNQYSMASFAIAAPESHSFQGRDRTSSSHREGSRRVSGTSEGSSSMETEQKKQFGDKGAHRYFQAPPKSSVPSGHAPDSLDDNLPIRLANRHSQRYRQTPISPPSSGPLPSTLFLKRSSENVSEISLFTTACAQQQKRSSWEQQVFRPARPQSSLDTTSPTETMGKRVPEASPRLIEPLQHDVLLEDLFAQGMTPQLEEGNSSDKRESISQVCDDREILLEDLYASIIEREARVRGETEDSFSVELNDFSPPQSPQVNRKPLPSAKANNNTFEKTKENECNCHNAMFSGNVDQIEFYLPKFAMRCTCGKQKWPLFDQGQVPVEKIFLPWQASFLKSLGIGTAKELVEAHGRKEIDLVKEMKRWRKANKMVPFKKEALRAALHIWTRTCKVILLSIQDPSCEGTDEARKGVA